MKPDAREGVNEEAEAMSEGEHLEQKLYEAMFLIDAAKGGAELPASVRHISGLLERHDAQIERVEKWAERKLAYKIKGVERGIYVLVYFRADPVRIAELRQAIVLSEEILRVLILKAKQIPEPTGELYTPQGSLVVEKPEPEEQPAGGSEAEEAPAVSVEAESAGEEQ